MNQQRLLIVLGWATLIGMSGIGIAIIAIFQEGSILDEFHRGLHWGWQVLAGLGYGFISAVLAWQLIHARFFTKEREVFSQMFQDLEPTPAIAIFISLCAGIGEEILFRAGIQPLFGIWPTAIVFILVHRIYINFKNWRISLYGLYLIIMSAGLGYLYEYVGLFAAIIAHAFYDWILFSEILPTPKGSVSHSDQDPYPELFTEDFEEIFPDHGKNPSDLENDPDSAPEQRE